MPWKTLPFVLFTLLVLAACGDDLPTQPLSGPDIDTPDFAIAGVSGAVINLSSPPASVIAGALQSNDGAFFFEERSGHELLSDLTVNVATSSVAGRHHHANLQGKAGTIPAGTVVSSYLLHLDAVSSGLIAQGELTFDSPILGLILSNDELGESDSKVGAPATSYPSFQDISRRAVHIEAGDTVWISPDRQRVWFQIRIGGSFIDQVRIVTGGGSSDETPPVITGDVAGTEGDNGWYVSDVSVSWTVADPESSISSQSGCTPSSVTTDTNGQTFTCEATSDGGTSSETASIKRDATIPVIAFTGNAGSYTVDQTVDIACSATDATSGIASSHCPGASGDAYTFTLGTNTLDATASDLAGNSATASTSFTVEVTAGSLCVLTERWVRKRGVARAMCKKLENGAHRAYVNHVRAQSGKSLSEAHAAILVELAGQM